MMAPNATDHSIPSPSPLTLRYNTMMRRVQFFVVALSSLVWLLSSGCGDDRLPCGDGKINWGDVCDGDNLDGQTCQTLGFEGGELGCSATCEAFDTSLCYLCGNGLVEINEECDDSGESPACDADCTVASCGDGTVNASAGEFCDDSGESAACDVDCTPSECGDGVVNPTAGEECDGDGEGNGGETAACNADCTMASCGDGVTNTTAGEQCDDGGETANCDLDCTPAMCGDGNVNGSAGEACDGDGMGVGGETPICDADCSFSLCGDGTINVMAGEQCDGNGMGMGGETPTCDVDCTPAQCNDGVVNFSAGEQCDGGDLGGATCSSFPPLDNGNLACTASCTFDTSGCGNCGNGVIDGVEECDGFALGGLDCPDFPPLDNGTLSCTGTCVYNLTGCGECGNGVVDGDEFCDTNDLAGQTCTSQGYLPGVLSCLGSCDFNLTGCTNNQFLQNDNSICSEAIGCSDTGGAGTSGNPNEIVECYSSAMTAPLELTQVYYDIVDDIANPGNPPPPDELFVEIYTWSGAGAPGTLVDTYTLTGAELNRGPHLVNLSPPLQITTSDFCIGINGYDLADGYRLMKSTTTSVSNVSYIRAPDCGATVFTSTAAIGFPGNWCIRGTVEKPYP